MRGSQSPPRFATLHLPESVVGILRILPRIYRSLQIRAVHDHSWDTQFGLGLDFQLDFPVGGVPLSEGKS